MTVKVFDRQTAAWSTLKTFGKAPVCICYSFKFINPKMFSKILNLVLGVCDMSHVTFAFLMHKFYGF